MENIENLNESELVELWQVNQIPEEVQRIFDAVGLEMQQLLRNLRFPLPP